MRFCKGIKKMTKKNDYTKYEKFEDMAVILINRLEKQENKINNGNDE